MADHGKDKLMDVTVPEFTANQRRWTEYALLEESENAIVDQLETLSNENDTALQNRKQIAVDLSALAGHIQRQIDILTQSDSFNMSVMNNDKVSELFAAKDGVGVDGKGKSAMKFLLNDVLRMALIYRKVYVVIDRMPIDGPKTEAQMESLGKPFAFVVNPLNMPAFNMQGPASIQLDRAIMLSTITGGKEERGFCTEVIKTATLWTEDEIITENKDGELVKDTMINTLGEVPILVFELPESLYKNLWRAVMAMLQQFSLSNMGGASQIHGHPFIFSDVDVKQIDTGFNKATQLPESARVDIVHSPVEGLKFNLELVDKLEKFIFKQVKQNMTSMTLESVVQSGASKKVDMVPQEEFSQFLADELATFFPVFANLFAKYFDRNGQGGPVEVNIEIPEQFVAKDPNNERADATFLANTYKPSTEGQFVAAKQLEREKAGIEKKMTKDQIKDDDEALIAMAADVINGGEGLAPAFNE